MYVCVYLYLCFMHVFCVYLYLRERLCVWVCVCVCVCLCTHILFWRMFDKQTKQLLSYNLPLTEDCFDKHSGLIATQNLGLYSRTYGNLGVINPLIVSSFHLGDSVIKAGTKSAVKGNK